jgi:flagellin-like protein
MQKRGVSEIVATVLIIVIVVAAVGILWTVVSPMIKNNLNQISCSDIKLTIDLDKELTCSDISKNRTTIMIKRGADNFNITGLKVSLISNGTSFNTQIKAPEPSQILTATISDTKFNSDEVKIIPIINYNGKQKTCDIVITSTVPTCTLDESFKPNEVKLNEDSNSNVPICAKNSDCEVKNCKNATCNSGVCEYTNSPSGNTCTGGFCNGAGACLQCLSNSDCDNSGLCSAKNTCDSAGKCVHSDQFPCDIYSDGFETDGPGWTHYATMPNEDFWSISSNSRSGSRSFSVSQHSGLASDALESSIINLTGVSSAYLELFQNYYFDDCNTPNFIPDGVRFELSQDGGINWLIIDPLIGYPFSLDNGCPVSGWQSSLVFSQNTGGNWQKSTFDLTPFVGGLIKVRAHAEWDCGNCNLDKNSQSVYFVDDVKVVRTA